MKRMISKIMLVALVIGSIPMHIVCAPVLAPAGWSDSLRAAASSGLQMVRNNSRSALQSIAQNPGWTSWVIAGVIAKASVYAWYKKQIAYNENEISRLDAILQARNAANQQGNKNTIDTSKLNTASTSSLLQQQVPSDQQEGEVEGVLGGDQQEDELEGVPGGPSATFAHADAQAQPEIINVSSDGAAIGLSAEEVATQRASHQQQIKDTRFNKLWLPCGGIALVMAATAFIGSQVSKGAGWLGSGI